MSSNLNARVQELIVELSFRKGSDRITAGRTAKGNNTLTGKLVWSDNLVVNNRRVEVGLDAEEAHGIKTIINIPVDADAFNVISKCNAIQAGREPNALGNKEPFVYAVIKTSELIIFNQGFGSSENDVDRISVLDVSATDIEINGSCPAKAAKPRIGVRAARVVNVAKSQSFYDYWLRKQTEEQMIVDVTPKSKNGGLVNLDDLTTSEKGVDDANKTKAQVKAANLSLGMAAAKETQEIINSLSDAELEALLQKRKAKKSADSNGGITANV